MAKSKSLKDGIEGLLYGITHKNTNVIEDNMAPEQNNQYAYQHVDAEKELTDMLLKSSSESTEPITLKVIFDKISKLEQEMQNLNAEQTFLLIDLIGERPTEGNLKLNPVEGILPNLYVMCQNLEQQIQIGLTNTKKIRNILG